MEISKKNVKNFPNFKLLVLGDYSIISVEILTGSRTTPTVFIVELFSNIFSISHGRKCGILIQTCGIKIWLTNKYTHRHSAALIRVQKVPTLDVG